MIPIKLIAEILKVNEKNIRRYIAQGRLKAKKEKINKKEFRYVVKKPDLWEFVNTEKSYEKLLPHIKEIYSLNVCGLSNEEIVKSFNYYNSTGGSVLEKEVILALDKYQRFRKKRLDYCGIPKKEHKKYFTPGETCARLKIRDLHVIYHLIETGELEKTEIKKNLSHFGDNVFVSVDSVIHYLGADRKTRFYTSRDISKITGKTVNSIDRIALYYEIGRKLKKNNKNSIYLFSYNDVIKISKLKKPNGWDINKKREKK